MVVEFFGISGVGKTTLAKKYYDELVHQGTYVVWNGYDLYSKKSWLQRNLIKSKSVVTFLFTHYPWCAEFFVLLTSIGVRKRELIKLYFNGIFLKYTLSDLQKVKGISFVDEGVLQYIWSVCLRIDGMMSKLNLLKFISMFQLGEKIVVVEANTETISERLINRGEKTKIMETKDLRTQIIRMKSIQDQIIETLSQSGVVSKNQIVHIDNNTSW